MPPFWILKAFADGGVTGLGARPAEKSGGEASSRQPRLENLRETAGKLSCGWEQEWRCRVSASKNPQKVELLPFSFSRLREAGAKE